MRGLSLLRRSPALIVAAVAVAAAVGTGIALASIPDSNGVIHGCYNTGSNPSGALRVIDTAKGTTCAKNEKPLNWNQTGPKGDTGDRGPIGPSDAWSVTDSATNLSPSSEATLAGAGVGAGDYVINAKTQLTNNSFTPLGVSCELVDADGNVFDTSSADLAGNNGEGDIQTIPLQAGVDIPSFTTVFIKCQAGGGNDGDVVATETSLTLIKVGALH
jgi:hypothetical protein